MLHYRAFSVTLEGHDAILNVDINTLHLDLIKLFR